MFNSSDAPPDHFTDWSGWNWFLGIAGTFLMLAIALIALWFVVALRDSASSDEPFWKVAIAAIVGFVAFVLASWCHYEVARHMSESNHWWWVLPLVALIACAGLVNSYHGSNLPIWTAMAGFVLMAGFTSAGDGLSRLAASIPIALGSLILLIVLGTVGIAVYASSDSR